MKLELLIIDEVSMVASNKIDPIDVILKSVKKTSITNWVEFRNFYQ